MSEQKRPRETVTDDDDATTIFNSKRPRSDEIVTDDDIFAHGRLVLECDTCGSYFFSQQCLDACVRRHKLQRDYHCRICDKSYTTADGLKLHEKSAHSEPSPRVIQQGGGVAPSDDLGQVRLKLINVLQIPTPSIKLFILLAEAQFYLFL